MNAIERKIQFLVTVETLTVAGDDLISQIEEIKGRIIEQLAGHRTNKRLADTCRVEYQGIISETSREL